MSYDILTRKMQIRPIQKWPGDLTPDSLRRHSQFKSALSDTYTLLDRELYNVGAEATVLQVALDESDFRINGLPRANVRAEHPGVILAFNPDGDAANRLEFATDVFNHWEDNLRGVALGLEALRKVDRYGITSGSQQYAGFRAITAGDDGSMGLYSATAAQHYLDEKYDGDLKQAIRDTHPDRNPDADPDELRRVLRVKALLGK